MTDETRLAQVEPQAIEGSVGSRGVEVRTPEDLWRMAKMVAQSGLAPKGIQSPAAIATIIQHGLEVGLAPMQALQNIALINGKPRLYGDAPLALVAASGVFDHGAFLEEISGEGDQMVASCTVRRLPGGREQTRSFSVADAKKAKLWGKAGPWQEYPRRMLQMRARSLALRDVFPDYLGGIGIREEYEGVVEQPVRQPRREQVTIEQMGIEMEVDHEGE